MILYDLRTLYVYDEIYASVKTIECFREEVCGNFSQNVGECHYQEQT